MVGDTRSSKIYSEKELNYFSVAINHFYFTFVNWVSLLKILQLYFICN